MGPKRFCLGLDKPFEEFYRKAVRYTFVHFYLILKNIAYKNPIVYVTYIRFFIL